MNKKNKKIIIAGIIVLIAILALPIIARSLTQAVNIVSSPQKPYYLVSCSVSITNPLFKEVTFESINCVNKGTCTGYISFNPLAWLGTKDTGIISMEIAGSKVASKSYELWETANDKFTLDKCSQQTSGNLIIYDNKGAEITRRAFEV